MKRKISLDAKRYNYFWSMIASVLFVGVSVWMVDYGRDFDSLWTRLFLIVLHTTKFFALLIGSRLCFLFGRRMYGLFQGRYSENYLLFAVRFTRIFVLLCLCVFIFYAFARELHNPAEVTNVLALKDFINTGPSGTLPLWFPSNIYVQLLYSWFVLALSIWLEYRNHRI